MCISVSVFRPILVSVFVPQCGLSVSVCLCVFICVFPTVRGMCLYVCLCIRVCARLFCACVCVLVWVGCITCMCEVFMCEVRVCVSVCATGMPCACTFVVIDRRVPTCVEVPGGSSSPLAISLSASVSPVYRYSITPLILLLETSTSAAHLIS